MDSLSLGVLPWDLRLTSDSVKGCGGTIHKRGALIPFPCKLNPKWISSICRHHKLQLRESETEASVKFLVSGHCSLLRGSLRGKYDGGDWKQK